MRNLFLFFSILVLFQSPMSWAASYIAFGDFNTSANNLVLTSDQTLGYEYASAHGFEFQFGHFFSNSLALELGLFSADFRPFIDKLLTGEDFVTEGKLTGRQLGIRWFWFEFFNVHFGTIELEYNPKVNTSGTIEANYRAKTKEYYSYYGLGLGMTFSKMQLYWDQKNILIENARDSVSYSLGLRIFF